MSQSYPSIDENVNSVREGILALESRTDSLKSSFSGMSFPSVDSGDEVLLCWRTDESKLYMLKTTGPDVWVNIPLGVPLELAQGGTGATSAGDARSNLGIGAVATENILPIAKGGTGANNAQDALINLDITLDNIDPTQGTETVQTLDDSITTIAEWDIEEGEILTVRCMIHGLKNDETDCVSGFAIVGAKRATGGDVSIIGTPHILLSDDPEGLLDVTFNADIVNQRLQAQVKGVVGEIFNWKLLWRKLEGI